MNDQIDIHFKSATTSISFENDFCFEDHFDTSDTIIVTDCNIMKYYNEFTMPYKVILVKNGDMCKTVESTNDVINQLLEYKADRKTRLVAFGGGAVCDLTSYVASIYMRGLKHSFVPTTLLSMVDSSIGGKTAINYGNIKNLLGTFKHPEKVIICSKFLDTLPDIEYYSGLAELLKITLTSECDLFHQLANLNLDDRQNVDKSIIYQSILRKSEIVIKDEQDLGIRNILNFGHTFGHLIEGEYNIPHGSAVLKGMIFALHLSSHLNLLKHEAYTTSLYMLGKYDKYDIEIDFSLLLSRLVTDKKKSDDTINFILLKEIGTALIKNIELTELEKLCAEVIAVKYA